MPSIPQSLLWISLVVLWLFVLVPMLINRRDTVRRTSDVALATRVLNGGARSRLIRRRGPATGHRHDPDWAPEEEAFVEDYSERDEIADYDDAVREARVRATTQTRSVMVVAAVTERTTVESDYLDVDVVDENSGALPVGTGVQATLFDPATETHDEVESVDAQAVATGEPTVAADDDEAELEYKPVPEPESAPDPEPVADTAESEPAADEYEFIDDTSGLEAEDDAPVAPRASRRRRMESNTAAMVTARKYRFRKRVLTAMVAIMMVTALLAATVSPAMWWACASTATVTLLYLAYLRRQTRIEEQVRRRRQQRMARMRAAEFDHLDEHVAERGPEVGRTDFPTRLQRPGTAVLEIDDEDPIFEHLDEVAYSRHYDLPRAAGQ